MAVALGTNSGFVSAAPVDDPSGSGVGAGGLTGRAWAVKHQSPVGSYKVTQIGFYQSLAANDAGDYELGIYSHDAVNTRPDARLLQLTGGSFPANTVGWYDLAADYELVSNTTYWIAEHNDTGAGKSNLDYSLVASNTSLKDNIAALPAPWGASTTDYNNIIVAIYAFYEAAGGGISIPVVHYLRQSN